MTYNFTLIDVINSTREVVKENPTRQYWGADVPVGNIPHVCTYIDDDGDFDCVMGQALGRLGVPKEVLLENQNIAISSVLETLLNFTVDDRKRPNEPRMSREDRNRIKWLETVQDYQDKNHSWVMAIHIADSLIKLGV